MVIFSLSAKPGVFADKALLVPADVQMLRLYYQWKPVTSGPGYAKLTWQNILRMHFKGLGDGGADSHSKQQKQSLS